MAPGPVPTPRLRAGDHPGRRRGDLGGGEALGGARRRLRAGRRHRVCGPSRRGSSAPGSTTSPPTTTCTSARAATRSRRWRSGTAASASGAPSPAGCSAPGSTPAATGSCSGRWPTRSRPGLLLAQAIGRFGNYFNQELYGRPTKLPWGLEIDPEQVADRPDASRSGPRSTRRSSTRPCGTSPGSRCWSTSTALQARLRARVRGLRDDLHRRTRLDREPADRHHRAQQRARPAAGTCGCRSCCSCGAAAYFVVTGRRHRPPNTREPSPYVEAPVLADRRRRPRGGCRARRRRGGRRARCERATDPDSNAA